MITNNEDTSSDNGLSMDLGLQVVYDGDRNTLLGNGKVIDYPTGGLITEYLRLSPTEIKSVILSCTHLSDEPNPDNLVTFVLDYFQKVTERFEPAIAWMTTIEIFNRFDEWNEAERNNRSEEYLEGLADICDEGINKFIFEDTGYDGIGRETVCQLALSAYASFAISYCHMKYAFEMIVKTAQGEEEDEEKAVQIISSLYTELIGVQHIDFRIISTGEEFHSLYTIKSSMSLLVFELSHCMEKEIPFLKCANCGHYFVPDGRIDQIYCTYQSPQRDGKTCREIGAQVTRANKEKNDVVTREYRKTYMRYKMNAKRHPGNRNVANRFDDLVSGMKEWRKKLANGSATVDAFLEWVRQF